MRCIESHDNFARDQRTNQAMLCQLTFSPDLFPANLFVSNMKLK
jgi:hypothetical protein